MEIDRRGGGTLLEYLFMIIYFNFSPGDRDGPVAQAHVRRVFLQTRFDE